MVQFIVSGALGTSGLNYFIIDLVVTLLSWAPAKLEVAVAIGIILLSVVTWVLFRIGTLLHDLLSSSWLIVITTRGLYWEITLNWSRLWWRAGQNTFLYQQSELLQWVFSSNVYVNVVPHQSDLRQFQGEGCKWTEQSHGNSASGSCSSQRVVPFWWLFWCRQREVVWWMSQFLVSDLILFIFRTVSLRHWPWIWVSSTRMSTVEQLLSSAWLWPIWMTTKL